jgi:hypothetical protein
MGSGEGVGSIVGASVGATSGASVCCAAGELQAQFARASNKTSVKTIVLFMMRLLIVKDKYLCSNHNFDHYYTENAEKTGMQEAYIALAERKFGEVSAYS